MKQKQKTTLRYSLGFKQHIVNEIENNGKTVSDIKRIYDIRGGETIQSWLKKLGKNHLLNKVVRIEMKDEKDKVKELEAEIKKLKIKLAESVMINDLLETTIELANDLYSTDLKKNLVSML